MATDQGRVNAPRESPETSFKYAHTLWTYGGTGYITLPHIRIEKIDGSITTTGFHDHFFAWPADREAIRSFIETPLTDLACTPGDGWGLYIAPAVFTSKRRDKRLVSAPRWLWADLDEANPDDFPEDVPRPTITLETSPGRFQGVWLLDRAIDPSRAEQLSKGIAYTVKADRSGWDLTQILRLPGTINNKPGRDNFVVRIARIDRDPENQNRLRSYDPATLAPLALRADTLPTDTDAIAVLGSVVEGITRRDIEQQHQIPARVTRLLKATPRPGEDRSKRLFEIECLLAETGLSPENIYILVRDSLWNKFVGRTNEAMYLAKDVLKACRHVEAKQHQQQQQQTSDEPDDTNDAATDDDPDSSPAVSEIAVVRSLPDPIEDRVFIRQAIVDPGWLIDKILPDQQQLLVSGNSGSFKSFFTTDMAYSIATGTDFLGYFKTIKRKRTLLIQEENPDYMQQNRGRKVRGFKGLPHQTLDINDLREPWLWTANNYGYEFDDPAWQAWTKYQIEKNKIEVIIFDPLYLMLGSTNENDATEMRGIFRWVDQLRREFTLTQIIVHHNNNSGEVRGSSIIRAWRANSLTITSLSETDAKIKVARRYRGSGVKGPFIVSWELDESPGTLYIPHVTETEGTGGAEAAKTKMSNNRSKVLEAVLRVEAGSAISLAELAENCKIKSVETVHKHVIGLEDEGYCRLHVSEDTNYKKKMSVSPIHKHKQPIPIFRNGASEETAEEQYDDNED